MNTSVQSIMTLVLGYATTPSAYAFAPARPRLVLIESLAKWFESVDKVLTSTKKLPEYCWKPLDKCIIHISGRYRSNGGG